MGQRRQCAFKQCDLVRGIKAVRKAGVEVGRVEIHKDGKIIIVTGKPAEAALESNDLDHWIAKHARETEGH